MSLPHPELAQSLFVVFSDDWGRHPSSCQHLFRRIIPHAEVIWVNTVGLRTPRLSLYDLRRSIEVLAKWLGLGQKKTAASEAPAMKVAQPEVLRPFMLPFYQYAWVEKLNHILIHRAVEKRVKASQKRRILVSTLPIIPDLFKSPLWNSRIYYCVDDFTTWPGVAGAVMQRLEARTLRHCDQVIATSSRLLQTRGPQAKLSHLLTHGADVAHFASTSSQQPMPSLTQLPQPVVGFFGVFDARTDGNLLKRVAKAVAPGSVAVIGPVDRDRTEFADSSNIHFFGPQPYADLPRWAAGLSVLLLPYVLDASTESINPLKLKEYLATGLPVVATPLPEAVALQSDAVLAEGDAFVTAVQSALYTRASLVDHTTPSEREARTQWLAKETWEAKADAFCGFIFGAPAGAN